MVEPETVSGGHVGDRPGRGSAGHVVGGYPESVLEWIVVGVLYAFGLLFFQLLGGIDAAGRAIERWGRESSLKRLERSGLTPEDFARSRLGTRRR
jgi:hypothetical protein